MSEKPEPLIFSNIPVRLDATLCDQDEIWIEQEHDGQITAIRVWPVAALAPQSLREQMSDWQPMATAPKDGTWLLLSSVHGPRVARWMRDMSGDHWCQSVMLLGGACSVIQPTHWMPLPEPPAAPQPEKAE